MPKFIAAEPGSIKIGRGGSRKATETLAQYVAAIKVQDAGYIELEEGETYGTARRYLSAAAKELGIKVRATIDEPNNRVLWKRTG